jgi:spermidine synthase
MSDLIMKNKKGDHVSDLHTSMHLLVDLWNVKTIDELDYADKLLRSAAEKGDAAVLARTDHAFTVQGLTTAILITDGHISLHTWPEYEYIGLDIFLPKSCRHSQILDYLLESLEPQEMVIKRVTRGQLPDENHRATVRNEVENKNDDWFQEDTMPGNESGNVIHSLYMEKLIYSEKSPYQEIVIFDNPIYGRMLALDRIIQLSDSDEFIYNELLVHSILLLHPAPRRILIIGGGSGGALRECLRHDVEEVVLVEIDGKVIELCREYFSHVHCGAFDDSRLELRIGDARDIVKDYHDYFDVVIVDSGDAIGPSRSLYEANFYQDVDHALKADGMATLQVGSFLDQQHLHQTYERLKQRFPHVKMSRYTVASFNCGECCFMLAGKIDNIDNLSLGELKDRAQRRLHLDELRYYSPEIQLASLLVPPYLNFHEEERSEPSKMKSHIGTHLLVEFWNTKKINDPVQIKELLRTAVEKTSATVLGDAICTPTPQGFAALILLGESHLAMHISSNDNYVAVDIFTCGDSNYSNALAHMTDVLKPEKTKIEEVKRGDVECLNEDRNYVNASSMTMPPEGCEDRWFCEDKLPGKRKGNVSHTFRMREKLYEGQSAFQNILIFDNPMYGRTLVLDGIVQFTEADEFIYHEMLVHPVLLAHSSPCRVLVLGGGDGGILRECLRYSSVEEIVLVEIDEDVIKLCRKYFPKVNQGSFDDPRVEIHAGDARDVLKDYHEYFDVVIVDSSDSIGSSKALHSTEFYNNIHHSLKPDGIMTALMGSLLDQSYLRMSYEQLGLIFPYQSVTRINVPSYNCGEYCFMMAAKTDDVDAIALDVLKQRFNERLSDCRLNYYSPEMQLGSRLMPSCVNIK